ncbi:MAG: LCP family protein [Candidatus Moranbacteria bacterium]|nr:LCP family protein [Candidatus Moranbacteria bacterium]
MENGRTFGRRPGVEINGKKKKRWLKPLLIVVGIFFLLGGIVAWKTGFMLSKISTSGGGGLLSSLTHVIPGVSNDLKGEKEDRINILLMGMRGADDPAGGTLADTIMVASIEPKANKIALMSIPRDLYVTDPGRDSKSKINAVHALGEQNGKKQGIADMEKIVSEVTGIPIHYGMTIDFKGFKDLVDSLGGLQIHLDSGFSEPLQFLGATGRCDDTTFTVPTGQFETKKVKSKTKLGVVDHVTYRKFPLCATKTPSECGGNFKLDAGDITLTGDQALCFSRSRDTTSDFERAKRQQIIIQKIEEKATQLGTLSDFNKVNGMLNALGNNVKTDLQAWEMKKLYDLYRGMQKPEMIQRVLEDSEEGLLYAPGENPETGYILLPRGDNYNQIHNLFQNVFMLPAQSDIKPKI